MREHQALDLEHGASGLPRHTIDWMSGDVPSSLVYRLSEEADPLSPANLFPRQYGDVMTSDAEIRGQALAMAQAQLHGTNPATNDLLKEADKIYNWLRDGLQPKDG